MSHYPVDINYFLVPAISGRMELDLSDLDVEGEVPAQLDGAFFRMQPDPYFPRTTDEDVYFNGDGVVGRFDFSNGKVGFRQRYALTDKLKLERKAGRALFGRYRNPLTDDPSVKGAIRGTANTTPLVHGKKLYALKEDSPPLVMDANSLATQGYTDFNGRMKGQTFSAHSKIDPETGNLVSFGYCQTGPLTLDCTYMEVSPAGELLKEVWFTAPYYCMMHDFGVTKDYVVFPVVPMVSSWERLKALKPHFGFDKTLPIYLGVLPRNGKGEDIRWFKAPNQNACHVINAFNVGTKIHFDIPVSKGNGLWFFPDVDGSPFSAPDAMAFPTRWTVDYASKSDEFESVKKLSDMGGEFPRIDDRYISREHRYAWWLVIDLAKPFTEDVGRGMNALGYMDYRTGRQTSWWAGQQYHMQEPCFVPRSPGAPEGDGYIVVVVDNVVTNLSQLVILDAQAIDKGPIARVKLPFRLRAGLHGNWFDRSALPQG
ncbi:MAG: carotenoid oxygenase family protein [Gammaproteobacteria bacterium]|jgi:carotenoid cleavage dioxygenase-like enzyme|nr:carotenoid oxygenase family protein [Gammaproteobacteria bacterium]